MSGTGRETEKFVRTSERGELAATGTPSPKVNGGRAGQTFQNASSVPFYKAASLKIPFDGPSRAPVSLFRSPFFSRSLTFSSARDVDAAADSILAKEAAFLEQARDAI